MTERQQNSTTYPILFLMVDDTDHVTGKTGLSPTVTLSKNGGAFDAAEGAVAEVGDGWYSLAGDADDRDTLGELAIHAEGTAADPFDGRYVIVPWDPFDGVRLGLTGLPGLAITTGAVVSDGGNTALTFKTDLSETATDHWKDAFLLITSGALLGQVHRVTAYNGSTKFVTVTTAFSAAPSAAVTFLLVNR